MFKRTTAQAKIAALRSRVRVVQGGTSSSKTFSILPILITYAAARANSEISIVAETIPHLRRGAMRDFIKIMEWTGNYNPDNWNRSSFTYRFANGSFIEFFSASDEAKLRGARRDVLFVNEANNIPWEAYHQLAIRTRRFIYIDYNPTGEFWAHTELIGQPSTDFVVLNYTHNEALEPAIVREIEAARTRAETSTYWANWWRVYGLGEVGSLQGVVFNNWQQVDEMPTTFKWKAYGLDWGYTNDPTAFVEVVEFDGKLWLNEVLYETGLTNADIAAKLNAYKQWETIADSAEPKSVEDLRRHGFRIRPCKKGPDSVRIGLDKMQQMPIMVTSSSTNLIKELRGYVWRTEKDGSKTNEPIDYFNHAIDAARYCIMEKLNARSGTYAIK
jgi:phage terminase large subunit